MKIISCFLLLLSSHFTVSQDDISDLWQQYATQMASLLSTTPDNVMLFGFEAKPYNFNLNISDPKDIDLIHLVDVEPWNINGPTTQFYQNYDAVLREIDVPPLDDSRQGELDDLHNRSKPLRDASNAIQLQCLSEYASQCAALLAFDLGLSCEAPNDYLDENGCTKEMSTYQQQITNIDVQISAIVGTQQSHLAIAVDRAIGNDPQGFIQAAEFNADGSTTIQSAFSPNYFTEPSAAQLISNFDQLSSSGFTIQVDHTTQHTFFSEDKFKVGGAVSYFIFCVGADATVDLTKMTEDDTEFQMTMSLNKWAKVQVTPDVWYDDVALEVLAQSDQYLKEGSTFIPFEDGSDRIPIFGARGILNSRVNGLIVASDIDITLKFSEHTYSDVKKVIDASASIGIGPFRLKLGNVHHEDETTNTDDVNHEFTASIKSNIPQIIGYQTVRINDAFDPSKTDDTTTGSSSALNTQGPAAGTILAIVLLSITVAALAGVIFYQQRKLRRKRGQGVDMHAFQQLPNTAVEP